MTSARRPPGASNLPLHRSPLVGRIEEAAEVRRLLLRSDVSILTLTGPGGIGKTRLAIQVANELRNQFSNGVFFVPLAQLRNPDLVEAAICEALDLTHGSGGCSANSVRVHLRDKEILLLLDNFEHVVDAAPLVAMLMSSCPSLKVLATSRMPLRLSGEHDFPVPPLGLPDPSSRQSLSALAGTDAVALFLHRASAADPHFALTEANAADVAEICVPLDGLPLALELAAAKIRLLTPAALRARLINRLLLLTDGPRDYPPRLQSLRDAVAWSNDLLGPAEQALFRRLCVFTGGFTLEAAEAVAGSLHLEQAPLPEGVQAQLPSMHTRAIGSTEYGLDLLSSLVESSLVAPPKGDDVDSRFSILETIREFGLDQLGARGETTATQGRHATYFLHLAEVAESNRRGKHQEYWLAKIGSEHANLRAALVWLAEREVGQALRLAGSLTWFWLARGSLSYGRELLESLLAGAKNDQSVEAALLAKAVLAVADLLDAEDDYRASEIRFAEALSLFCDLDNPIGIARSKLGLARACFARGDWERATVLSEESLRLTRDAGDSSGIASALEFLGTVALENDDYDRARECYQESLAICRSLSDWATGANILTMLGLIAQFQGDLEKADALIVEALALARAREDSPSVAERLGRLASIALDAGDPALAAIRAQEGASLFAAAAVEIPPWIRAVVLHNLGTATRRMGDPARALAIHESALDLLRELGSPPGWSAAVTIELANDVRELHDTHRAAVLGGEGLAVQRQVNDRRGAAAALEGLAATVVAQGRAAAAARFVAAAEQIRKELGAPLPPGDRADIARTLAEARKALGAVDFANVSASARLLPADDMVLEALTLATRMAGEAPPAQPETDRDGSIASPFGLTPRELGVLRLLVEGHSNPRIAAVLFISQRTVRNHVTSILAKLGVDSRTAAATFALRRGLV